MSEIYPKDERIEQYLLGQMNPEEQTSFEQEMESDPALANQVRALLGAKFVGHMQMREAQKSELIENYKASPRPAFWQQQRWLYIVAAAAVILGLVWVLWPRPQNYEKLYLAYFEAVPAQVIRDTSSTQRDLRLSHIAFNQNNFDEAIRGYEQLLQNSPETGPQIALFLGQSYLENKAFDLAIAQFDQATDSPQEASWFKALTYVRAGEEGLAKDLLREIANNQNHFYSEKAKALLDEW